MVIRGTDAVGNHAETVTTWLVSESARKEERFIGGGLSSGEMAWLSAVLAMALRWRRSVK